MVKIPLKAIPSQTLKVKLNNQNCIIRLYYRFGNMYLDLNSNGLDVCKGAICRDRASIVQVTNTKFNGGLYFIDMLGDSDPIYKNIGSRYRLFYIPPSETIPEGLSL